MKETLFIGLQKLAPQHLLSRISGWFANNETSWFKNFIIEKFIKKYHVDMSLALNEDPQSYSCFNDFFVRQLKDNARPIDENPNNIVSPADGVVSQAGTINQGKIFQAKGHSFTTGELLGDEAIAEQFNGGNFATIYLSPKDYHRVHMPADGQLSQMNYIPGDLFSVNDTTVRKVPNLFARNERIAAIFESPRGPVAVVMVGALIVGSIETVWDGQITPASKAVKTFTYSKKRNITLSKGDEMGRFKLGSTAVLLFAKDVMQWDESFARNSPVEVGKKIGTYQQLNE